MEFTAMSNNCPTIQLSGMDQCILRMGKEIARLAPINEGGKILLLAYMEPPWVFPALVGMVDRRWSAGNLPPERIPQFTRVVEKWLDATEFFHRDTPAIVRRLFAGTLAITSHKIFATPNRAHLN
jgi:hypothetical protein